jgi:2,4-diketo-3-deoxy-L-fuconate hydrolase
MKYSLAALSTADGALPVVEVAGQYFRLEDLVAGLVADRGHAVLDLFSNWDNSNRAIASALASEGHHGLEAIAGVTPQDFLSPLQYPSKVLCTGINYYDHLRLDMKINDFNKSKHDILYFLKHSRAIVGAAQGVRFPSQSRELDWEVELVVVFGKRARRISVENALSCVAGYAIGLDLSARDWQMNPRHFKQFDLLAGKSFDDSSPLGPVIVPAQFVEPSDLSLRLWVNDELKQDSNTREMIWSIPEQIAQLSQHMTIEPGDILYTGSPAGIGWVKGTFLKVGDRITADIHGLGRLCIDIKPDPDAASAALL